MNQAGRGSALMRRAFSWVTTLCVASGLMLGLGALRAPALPDEAPDFRAQTLSGETLHLSDLKGRPVVLNFWATWCGPCRFEIPALSRLAKRHPDLVVWGLSTESAETLKGARIELGATYPILRVSQHTLDTFGISTFPTTLFLNAEGQIRHAYVGALWDPFFEGALLGL